MGRVPAIAAGGDRPGPSMTAPAMRDMTPRRTDHGHCLRHHRRSVSRPRPTRARTAAGRSFGRRRRLCMAALGGPHVLDVQGGQRDLSHRPGRIGPRRCSPTGARGSGALRRGVRPDRRLVHRSAVRRRTGAARPVWSRERLEHRHRCADPAHGGPRALRDQRRRRHRLPRHRWERHVAGSVGIRHPSERDAVAAVLEVGTAAVATSGTYERGNHLWGRRGASSADGLASVTVVGPELAIADALATALFVEGSGAPRWFERFPGYDRLVITASGRVRWTSGLDDLLQGAPECLSNPIADAYRR